MREANDKPVGGTARACFIWQSLYQTACALADQHPFNLHRPGDPAKRNLVDARLNYFNCPPTWPQLHSFLSTFALPYPTQLLSFAHPHLVNEIYSS
jgi:hypothetical protein